VAIYDPTPLEIVGRKLELDPVTQQDANPVTAHLACGVPECLVAVVERDPVHAAPERLHNLPVDHDLVFLVGDESLSVKDVGCA
jgi:hypothetical protein